jgi:hypothetical protein
LPLALGVCATHLRSLQRYEAVCQQHCSPTSNPAFMCDTEPCSADQRVTEHYHADSWTNIVTPAVTYLVDGGGQVTVADNPLDFGQMLVAVDQCFVVCALLPFPGKQHPQLL